jgi:hypothetical protein
MRKHDDGCLKQKFPCCEDLMCPCDLAEFERIQAENARLREALIKIDNMTSNTDKDWDIIAIDAVSIAHEALKGGE